MLNKEKYKDEILEIALEHSQAALKNGKLCPCNQTLCELCDFHNENDCDEVFQIWANSEYEPEIDWLEVPEDTPVLARNKKDNPWVRRYFCKYRSLVDDYKFETFSEGRTSWSSNKASFGFRYCKLAREEDIEKYRKR